MPKAIKSTKPSSRRVAAKGREPRGTKSAEYSAEDRLNEMLETALRLGRKGDLRAMKLAVDLLLKHRDKEAREVKPIEIIQVTRPAACPRCGYDPCVPASPRAPDKG